MRNLPERTERRNAATALATCPCGFTAPPGVHPSSEAWHRGHRDQHLAKYPAADAGTRASLDTLVDLAARHQIVQQAAVS